MKTTTARAVLVLVVLAGLWLAGAAAVRAADPDLIGGQLSATPETVTLTSQATVPARVVMATDGPFTLTPTRFTIDPGETVTMTVEGEARGTVAASMYVLDNAALGETSSVTLEVVFPLPAAPVFPWALGLMVIGALIFLAFAIRWVRRNLRIQIGRAS